MKGVGGLYLTGARRKRGDWRDVQNLQLIHVSVQNDGGSVHISGSGRRVPLGEIVIDELADYGSFAHCGSTDHCDTQRLHHSWSSGSAPWTATASQTLEVHGSEGIQFPAARQTRSIQIPRTGLNCVCASDTNQWVNKPPNPQEQSGKTLSPRWGEAREKSRSLL